MSERTRGFLKSITRRVEFMAVLVIFGTKMTSQDIFGSFLDQAKNEQKLTSLQQLINKKENLINRILHLIVPQLLELGKP